MARIDGAGLSANGAGARMEAPEEPRWAPATGGAFGPLARAQYAALAAMRWQAFRKGLRSTRGALEAAAGGLSYVLYGFMGLGITAGMGVGAYFMVSNGMWALLPLLLWALFFLWQAMPVGVAASQQQFDLNGLLRFPMGFAPFFVLHLLFGLVDPSTLLGGLGCFGIWTGITIARPALSAWAAPALLAFAVFNVLLSRAIFAWLDRWLAQRRTREILSFLFVAAVLSLQFLNPALHQHNHARRTRAERAAALQRLAAAGAAQNWAPPGLVVLGIERAAESRPSAALGAIGLLGFYGLATGFALAIRLRAEHRGEILSDAPRPRKLEKRASAASAQSPPSIKRSLGGSGPIAAVIEKDLRVMLRALPLLYAIGAPLLMVLVLASIMGRSRHGILNLPIALPLCVVYALLGFTQLIYNNLGTEGAGIQLLFLSPTPIRTVLLAKNLFHALLFGLIALAAGALACFRLGAPDPVWLAVTAAWLVFALPAHLAVGNILSITMPHRVNMSRIGRQRGAQASALLGLLVQLAVLAVGVLTVGLCTFFGRLWLAAPLFVVLAIPACIAWLRILGNAEAMANRRRDELIATLAKAE